MQITQAELPEVDNWRIFRYIICRKEELKGTFRDEIKPPEIRRFLTEGIELDHEFIFSACPTHLDEQDLLTAHGREKVSLFMGIVTSFCFEAGISLPLFDSMNQWIKVFDHNNLFRAISFETGMEHDFLRELAFRGDFGFRDYLQRTYGLRSFEIRFLLRSLELTAMEVVNDINVGRSRRHIYVALHYLMDEARQAGQLDVALRSAKAISDLIKDIETTEKYQDDDFVQSIEDWKKKITADENKVIDAKGNVIELETWD